MKKCNALDEAVLVKGDRGGKKEQPKSYQTFFYSSTLSTRVAFYASFRFTLCTFSSSNDGNGFCLLRKNAFSTKRRIEGGATLYDAS